MENYYMKDVKKFWMRFLFTFLILLCFLSMFSEYTYMLKYIDLTPWNHQKITDVEAEIELIDEEDLGTKVLVTEKLTFEVHQASKNDLCYVLWKNIPERMSGKPRLTYEIISVKQIMDDGTEIPFTESSTPYKYDSEYKHGARKWYYNNDYIDYHERIFFYVDGIYRDTVTFEITYILTNAIQKYNDCSDFNISLYPEDYIPDLNSYSAEILIPDKDMPQEGYYEYYTYGSNSDGFPVYESDVSYDSSDSSSDYHIFSINLNKEQLKFKPYNSYLTFELVAHGVDKHKFTDSLNSDLKGNKLSEIRDEHQTTLKHIKNCHTFKMIVSVLMLTLSFIILFVTVTSKKRIKSKYTFYEPNVSVDYYKDIPNDLDPCFAATLLFSKNKKQKNKYGFYSALLLNLARKKYVTIKTYGKNKTIISINDIKHLQESSIMPLDPLTEIESLYYDLLTTLANCNVITMEEIQKRLSYYHENTFNFNENIKAAISDIGIKNAYFQNADFTEPKKHTLLDSKICRNIGLIFIFLINFISFHTPLDLAYGSYFVFGFTCLLCSMYLKSIAKNFVLLTQTGADGYAKWKGLYNYLNSDKIIADLNDTNIPMLEKYLVYAAAFEIPSKVTKALFTKSAQVANTPMKNYGSTLTDTYVKSGKIHVSGRKIGRTVHKVAWKYKYIFSVIFYTKDS